MVQIRLAAGSMAGGGRSWKPFSLALREERTVKNSYRRIRLVYVCILPLTLFSPVGAVSLGNGLRRLHQQLRGVWRGGHGGAEQEVLMLGQVLGRGLLGCPCTVEQLPLQKGQVCLVRKKYICEISF